MSSAKFGKHLAESFIGPANRTRKTKCESERLRTPDYLYRIMNHIRTENNLAEPKFGRGKRIKVWMNGEAHCYEFNINPNDFRSWTSILLHITNSAKPIFGAVRKLIALSTLKTIDNFEALDPKERYVGLGATCRFKMAPGGYRTCSEKELYKRDKVTKRFYTGELNSKVLPFLLETEKKKLTIIYVVVNGRTCQMPQKLVLNSNDMKNWVLMFKYLTKVLDIPDGIASMCTIFGDTLKEPLELQHGYLYVAVPFKEKFILMDYVSLFGDNHSKHRTSYTLSIKPAPPLPRVTATFKKFRRRISSLEISNKEKLPSRPSTPLHKKRSSRIPVKQVSKYTSLVDSVPQKISPRCESQPTSPVKEHQNPARCDLEPDSQTVNVRHEDQANDIDAYGKKEKNEKKYSEDEEKDSNRSNESVCTAVTNKTSTDSQPESLIESPTYTLVKIPSATLKIDSRIVSSCNLVTELKLEDKILATDRKLDDDSLEDGSTNVLIKSDILELPAVQQSTILVSSDGDQKKIRNGIMFLRHRPSIRIRNRTNISIYNVKTLERRRCLNLRPISSYVLNEKQKIKYKKSLKSKSTKTTWSQATFDPSYGIRKKSKNKTFTLNSYAPNENIKTLEEVGTECAENSLTDESLHSVHSKSLVMERGDVLDTDKWNVSLDRDRCSVDYKVKENILEIRDVRKCLRRSIGIGSFRVSTPEVESCLRYSLGDGKYISENRSYCSISSDSIESK